MSTRNLLVIGGPVGATHDAEAPRRDYAVLAARLGADVLQPGPDARRTRARSGMRLARAAARRAAAYDTVYCDSEHVGLPLAAMLRARRRPRLVVLAHYLSPMKKRLLIRLLGLPGRVDRLVVHSNAQAARARSVGFRDRQIVTVPYQVDAQFWRPGGDAAMCIASAGQEFRDYRTLLQASRGLPVPVEIAAGSYWSSRKRTFSDSDVPPNVSIGARSYRELRALYARAHFVVVPLLDVDFQAGIITILEAMSMGKAVIVSRTRGQRGIVSGPLMRDGATIDIGERAWHEPTGIYVPPEDPASLRAAIEYLLRNPERASAIGAAGRAHVEAALSVDHFAARVAAIIDPARAVASPPVMVAS